MRLKEKIDQKKNLKKYWWDQEFKELKEK